MVITLERIIIPAKCPNTVWVSDGEELAEVSDIEVS